MLLHQSPYELVTVGALLLDIHARPVMAVAAAGSETAFSPPGQPSPQHQHQQQPHHRGNSNHLHIINHSHNVTTNNIHQGNNLNLTTLDLDFSNQTEINSSGKVATSGERKKFSHCEALNFAVYGIVVGTFCLLGLSGNTLSIFVLQKDKSNEVASFLLQALAVADNLVLVISFVILSLIYGIIPYTSGSQATRPIFPYIVTFVHPLGYMAQTLTIWMTVLLAINRYIAVCRPFHATTLCTMKKARCQVIAVVMFSVCFNFPRFFQFQLVEKTRIPPTGDIEVFTSIRQTAIGENSVFGIVYTNAIYSILVLLLPLVFLAYLNICLAIELRNMRKRRNSMSTTPAPRDQNITLVMVIIIVIFMICHTPDRLLQGIKSLWTFKEEGCYNAFQNYTAVTNILITLNSSTNFLVYYFFRKRFRRILVMCVFCKDRNSRKYRLSSLSTNGLQQITLMSSLGAFERDTVHGSRLSLHRLSHNAVDRDQIARDIIASLGCSKSNSNSRVSLHSRLSNISNMAVREKLLIPPTQINGHRHSR